jgi:hypothetical protein
MKTEELSPTVPPVTDHDTKHTTPPKHEEITEDVGDPVIDNERKDIENADNPTEDE